MGEKRTAFGWPQYSVKQLNHWSFGIDLFLSPDYFFTGFFSHIKITGLAMKIVE